MKNGKLRFVLALAVMLCVLLSVGSAALAEEVMGYDVYVGDVRVTDANKDDVLGDGKVSYDPQTGTLTLNNAKITKGSVQVYYDPYGGDYDAYIGVYAKGDLTLNLTGSSTIDDSDKPEDEYDYTDTVGLYVEGNLEVNGSGSLTAKAAEYGEYSFGIYATGDMTVSSGSVSGIAGTGGLNGGVWTGGNMTVSGGSVRGTGNDGDESYGIGVGDTLIVNGGRVEAYGGEALGDSWGIWVDDDGVIVTDGVVYAEAGVSLEYYSRGLEADDGDVKISGGVVMVKGKKGYKSFGLYVDEDVLEITGGELHAIAGESTADETALDEDEMASAAIFVDDMNMSVDGNARVIAQDDASVGDTTGKHAAIATDTGITVSAQHRATGATQNDIPAGTLSLNQLKKGTPVVIGLSAEIILPPIADPDSGATSAVNLPQTGDNSAPMMWLALALASIGGMMMIRRRRSMN